MSLKPIPEEPLAKFCNGSCGKKQKHFNPGDKIKRRSANRHISLKEICLRLIRFINRGSKFTCEQIDEIIMAMQQAILGLQQRKHEMRMKRKK